MPSRISQLSPRQRRGAIWGLGALALVCALASAVPFAERGPAALDDIPEGWRASFLVWGAGAIVIAAAFYQKERKGPEGNLLQKRCSWFLGASALFLAVSLALPFASSRIAAALERKWPEQASTNAVAVKVAIPDMDCAACARGIDLLLKKVYAVEKADLNPGKREATIWYAPGEMSEKGLLERLKTNGYPAEVQR